MSWSFETDPEFQQKLDWIDTFTREEIEPLDLVFRGPGDPWDPDSPAARAMAPLREIVKKEKLWACHLGPELGGEGYGQVKLGLMNEILGRSRFGPSVFGCQAPDSGNAEILAHFGTPEQKAKYLQPLLDGKIASCYSMTEPHAGADPAEFTCTAERDGDEWVINGEKHWISGAGDPRCKIMIVMVKTDPDAPKHQQQSQILVPLDTPGVEIVRPMHVFSMDDAPHGHMELRLDNVRVPKDNIILGPGRGFEISQGRLGPGRIHHCMRALGAAEKALQLMCERATTRVAFGKPLARLGGNVDIIANARMDIEQARLLTLKAAWMMDHRDPKEARIWISMIKTAVPNVTLKIIDEAIQMFGGLGVSQDTPLATMYMGQRTLRLADGPDAVHRMVVGRHELKKYVTQDDVNATFRDG